uniref:7TM_GPCR_Srx domain-containing protein n=1 Tax=Strongyloides venezuelensis TaxID=75913 RepID=A0A0K0G5V4_STRVS
MMVSICAIIKEMKNRNGFFNTQFYTIIACKLINDIIFVVTILIFYKLPKWGFYNNFLENNDWTATIFYILAGQQTTFMFLITLLTSVNKFIAVEYPLSYKPYFSKSRMIIILLFFIILSTMIGLGNIFFNATFIKSDFFGYLTPSFKSKSSNYYQIFCQIFLCGSISIATCTLNIKAILTLKKLKKN